jgi:hypothetical protein
MRLELKRRSGQKLRFKAKVEDFKEVNTYSDREYDYYEWRIKLAHVTEIATDNIVVDEIWLRHTKTLQKMRLNEGDWIEFTAKVEEKLEGFKYYKLGIDDRELDYSLKYVSDVVKF